MDLDALTNDLRVFLEGMPVVDLDHGHQGRRQGEFLVDNNPPFDDFNKELVPPGSHPEAPEGLLGIRADDDFWTVACLPWRFHEIPIETIVSVLWPDIEDPKFGPDVGMYVPPSRQGN